MNILIELLLWIKDRILAILGFLFDYFMSINHFEKGIFINIIPAFFAVTLPVAEFYIFNNWYGINNPYAVYLLFIVFFMFITHFLRGKIILILRAGINIYYLAWVIYIGASGNLSAASYEVASGYYMNIITPLIYIAFSSGSFFLYADE